MNWRVALPAALTLGNGLTGFAALALLLSAGTDAPPLDWAASLIFVAWAFDMVDGMVARKLGTDGPFGAMLDSLCDVVSFGIVPAAMAGLATQTAATGPFGILGWLAGGAFLTAAILRLARFTTTPAGSHPAPSQARVFEGRIFEGLSAPAAAMVVAATIFALPQWTAVAALVATPLMVSRLPYADLAQMILAGHLPRWLAAAPLLLALLVGPDLALAVILWFYVPFGPIFGYWLRGKRENS